ncbi:MAG TPA: hypothetical protein VM840_06605 [Actinomycetota bacterium]|nr:hypothetical protein [Actinomycetota bacterium]
MRDERTVILEMVASGRITVDQATELLETVEPDRDTRSAAGADDDEEEL